MIEKCLVVCEQNFQQFVGKTPDFRLGVQKKHLPNWSGGNDSSVAPHAVNLREPLPRFIMGSQQKSISTKTRNKPGWGLDGMNLLNCYLNFNLIPFILLHPKNQPGSQVTDGLEIPNNPCKKTHPTPLFFAGLPGYPWFVGQGEITKKKTQLGWSHLPRF